MIPDLTELLKMVAVPHVFINGMCHHCYEEEEEINSDTCFGYRRPYYGIGTIKEVLKRNDLHGWNN